MSSDLSEMESLTECVLYIYDFIKSYPDMLALSCSRFNTQWRLVDMSDKFMLQDNVYSKAAF